MNFRKSLKYQVSSKSFQRKPSSSKQTLRHDEANIRFFANFANAHKNQL
jgi:hypothetical protein